MAEEETEAQSTEVEKKSSNLVLIIVIVALVIVLLIVGVVVAMLSGGDSGPAQSNNTPSKKEKRVSMESLEVGPMFPLDNFTVNLLSDSGRRYLKVEMNLELDDEEVAAELDTKTAVVRDVIIRLLSSKTLEEISTSKGKEKLKEQMINQLNLRLRDGNIRNIYFTEFVVQ